MEKRKSKRIKWKNTTLAILVERARLIHGDLYDYNSVDLTLINCVRSKIKVKCLIHGPFMQTIEAHLSEKRGCQKCAAYNAYRKLVITVDSLVSRLYKIYNNINLDELSELTNDDIINNQTLVPVICLNHIGGFHFTKEISRLLNGNGCPVCGKGPINHEIFEIRALEKHNGRFKHRLINGNDHIIASSLVEVICEYNHKSVKDVNSYLNSNSGCNKCGNASAAKARKLKIKDIVVRAKDIFKHENYNYSILENTSDSDIINNYSKVSLTCNAHKEPIIFSRTITDLLNERNGCRACYNGRKSKPETDWLNYIKISIDNRQVRLNNIKHLSVDGYDPTTNTVYEFYGDYWHGNLKKYNKDEWNQNTKKTFGDLYNKTIAREKVIKEAGYNLITIWESEWKEIKSTYKND